MELLGVLIAALLPIDLDAVVFHNVGLFVFKSLVFTVSLSIIAATSWSRLVRPSQWACFSVTLSPIHCAMTAAQG